jgi:hypothetical protein
MLPMLARSSAFFDPYTSAANAIFAATGKRLRKMPVDSALLRCRHGQGNRETIRFLGRPLGFSFSTPTDVSTRPLRCASGVFTGPAQKIASHGEFGALPNAQQHWLRDALRCFNSLKISSGLA